MLEISFAQISTSSGQVFFESFPQICTQTIFASIHGFNEGAENMASLQRVSVFGSIVALSCAIANYAYERRNQISVNIFINPVYHRCVCHRLSQ